MTDDDDDDDDMIYDDIILRQRSHISEFTRGIRVTPYAKSQCQRLAMLCWLNELPLQRRRATPSSQPRTGSRRPHRPAPRAGRCEPPLAGDAAARLARLWTQQPPSWAPPRLVRPAARRQRARRRRAGRQPRCRRLPPRRAPPRRHPSCPAAAPRRRRARQRRPRPAQCRRCHRRAQPRAHPCVRGSRSPAACCSSFPWWRGRRRWPRSPC
mmetsp:Transcript_25124/g.64917  ORF Transcript_25124/g.64917 Transcript_25124/m.64917 type:complete len:211 (+) Transcript_25124:11-643(+)